MTRIKSDKELTLDEMMQKIKAIEQKLEFYKKKDKEIREYYEYLTKLFKKRKKDEKTPKIK